MEAAAEAAKDVKILAVTVLTSLDRGDLDDLGFACELAQDACATTHLRFGDRTVEADDVQAAIQHGPCGAVAGGEAGRGFAPGASRVVHHEMMHLVSLVLPVGIRAGGGRASARKVEESCATGEHDGFGARQRQRRGG